METRAAEHKSTKKQLVGFFSTVSVSEPLVTLMMDYINDPMDYVIDHIEHPKKIAEYCLSLLNEEKSNNVASALNKLSDSARTTLLANWEQNQPLLYAYYEPRHNWRDDFIQKIKSLCFQNIPHAIRHCIKIKLKIHRNESPVSLLEHSSLHVNLSYTLFNDHLELNLANFKKVNLFKAKFGKTNAFQADFSDADLTDTEFTETDLQEITLSNTKLEGIRLNQVIINEKVKRQILQYVLKLQLPHDHDCYQTWQKIISTHPILPSDKCAVDDTIVDDCLTLLSTLGTKSESQSQNRLAI